MPDRKIVSLKKFKELARENNTENVGIRRQMPVEVKEVDEENRIIEFVSSTGTRDRDRDTINPNGWELGNYEKNPVFLWAHDYSSPPIGKSVANFIQNGQLRQKIKFVEKEIYPFADMIYRMYKEGYLNAVSVGFQPLEWEWSSNEDGNIDFDKQSLLETSGVPVPSNPEALQAAGIDGDKELIKQYAEEMQKWSKEVLELEGEKEEQEIIQLEIEPEFDKEKKDEEGNLIGETNCPHCDGDIFMRFNEDLAHQMGIEKLKSIGELELSLDIDTSKFQETIEEIKAGRVISAANEERLREARDMISQVLSQLETDDDDKSVENKDYIELEDEEINEDNTDEKNHDNGEDVIEIDEEDLEKVVQRAITQKTGKVF